MIIPDSNEITSGLGSLCHPKMLLVRLVALETCHKLALPEVTLAEDLSGYQKRIDLAIQRFVDEQGSDTSRQIVLGVVPWWGYRNEFAWGQSDELPLRDPAIRRHEEYVRQVVPTILATPAGAQDLAVDRTHLPAYKAEGSRKDLGARDQVFWLTAVEAAKTHPGRVFVVTKDKGFLSGSGEALRDILQQEAPANLRFCRSLDEMLLHLSRENNKLSREHLLALLQSETVKAALRFATSQSRALDRMESEHELLAAARWADMKIGNVAIRLANPDEVRFESRIVGRSVLITARAEWTGMVTLRHKQTHIHHGVEFSVITGIAMKAEGADLVSVYLVEREQIRIEPKDQP